MWDRPRRLLWRTLGRPFSKRTSSQAPSPEYSGTSISTETACAAWPIWGTAKSALAHLRHSPHANRFAFPCDCNELPSKDSFFELAQYVHLC
jgi:hypothetical protein